MPPWKHTISRIKAQGHIWCDQDHIRAYLYHICCYQVSFKNCTLPSVQLGSVFEFDYEIKKITSQKIFPQKIINDVSKMEDLV